MEVQYNLSMIKQRLEILYQLVEQMEQGGGGGGTDSYNDLSNKPQINGHTLTGNKTGSDLGLASTSDLSAYLKSNEAAATYQTLAGMSDYLTESDAASTYQTQAGMSNYLTTSDAASTYQTQAGMSNYYNKSEVEGEITGAINDLDKEAVGGSTKYLTTISEANGIIDATAASPDTVPTTSSTKLITSGGVKTYVDTAVQNGVAAETALREAADTALQTAIDGKATLSQVLGAGTGLSSGTDLNNVKTIGRYYWGSTVAAALANSPVSTYTLLSTEPADWETAYSSKYFEKYTEANTGKERYRFVQGNTAPTFVADTYYKCSGAGGTLTVENIQASSRVRQTFVENDTLAKSGRYFVRFFASSYSGTWSSWFMFEGTEVVPSPQLNMRTAVEPVGDDLTVEEGDER